MSIQRVALIYDDGLRPETTGVYCRRALSHLVDVEHVRPDGLDTLPRDAFDLYLNIDDGLRYAFPDDLRPAAFWAIDTHMDFDWCLKKSRSFEFVFAAQREGAQRLRDAGVARATWLPLACDPEVHHPHSVQKEHEVCFIGNVCPGPRADLLARIQREFPRTLVDRRYFEEMAKAFSASKVVFNRSVRNDLNMRVFEALACGSMLLTNDLVENGQAELFTDGTHLATYQSGEDLVDKLRFYLKREEAREQIAAAGRAEATAKHTYRHRMQQLLAAVERERRTHVSGPRSAVQRKSVAHDPSYFDFARPEILERIPQSAARILDIGCGAGRLGETIKARQGAHVVGIEQSAEAAAEARKRLDDVIVGDVEKLPLDFEGDAFDCVVCGDVLEHLSQPAVLLRKVRTWLSANGCLVASIPNVRHHSVIRSLLAGNWTYQPAGLLDGTHLQFFTRRSIEDLFSLAGFGIRQLGIVPGEGYAEWQQQTDPGEVQLGRLHLSAVPREEAEEFFVYQYLVVARPMVPSKQDGATNGPKRSRQGASRSKVAPAVTRKRTGPLRFHQDFVADFDEFRLDGPAYAFARFGDGERAICMRQAIDVPRDAWQYDGNGVTYADDLNAALQYSAPDYYLGISDSCCDRASQVWYLERVSLTLEQVTFANIFVNWNYRRFRQLNLSDAVIVSCTGGDFPVPENMFADEFDIDSLIGRLLDVERPILVAAGPLSAVIIHKYWQRAAHKQTILDVGSAIDEVTKGRTTRPYQIPGTRQAELVCHW